MKRTLYRIAWKHENGSFGAGEWLQEEFKSMLKEQMKSKTMENGYEIFNRCYLVYLRVGC